MSNPRITWIKSPRRKLKFGISVLRYENRIRGECIHNGLDDGEQCDEERSGEQCDDVGQATKDELWTGSDTVTNQVLADFNSPGQRQPAC